MENNYGSIDDLLMSGKTSTQPATPEHQYEEEPDVVDAPESESDYEEPEEPEAADDLEEEVKEEAREVDDYGNEKELENEVIRERLARQARKHEAEINALRAQLASHGASQQVQQAARDFEYNPNDAGDWQQQLAQFVRQEISNMTVEEKQKQQQQVEMEAYQQFHRKFSDGMERFGDFVETVSHQPIDDAMTMALRGMDDPAAFIYAAAKRNPQELERISKLKDPYARMVEMGKLEERMRKNKPTTKAPRPLDKTSQDASPSAPRKKSEPTIEDLIARSDAKKMIAMRNRRGR